MTDSTKESHESYATPTPIQEPGRKSRGGRGIMSGHRPSTGEELWQGSFGQKRDDCHRIVTSPVAADGLIFASGPKGQPVVAFRDGGKGDVTSTHRFGSFRTLPPTGRHQLLYKGWLYVLDGGKGIPNATQSQDWKTTVEREAGCRRAHLGSPQVWMGKFISSVKRGPYSLWLGQSSRC